jgi:hypothetical protein
MRKLVLGIVLLGGTSTARADVYSNHVHGDGAVAMFDRVDGCIEHSAVVQVDSSGAVLVFAQRYDHCVDSLQTWFTDGTQDLSASVHGLASAQVDGAGDLGGFPSSDTTSFDVGIWWTGTGAPRNEQSSSRSVGPDGITLFFSSGRTRNATVGGTFGFDGVDMSDNQVGAVLYSNVLGELSVP